MVIGFDGSKAFKKERTGVENYSYQLLLHLSKIDRKNRYLVYLDPRVNPKKIAGWPQNFNFKVINMPLMWTQLGLALQSYLDRMDVLFISAHTLPVLKNPFLKSVVTVHDLGAQYLGRMHQIKQRVYLGFMTYVQLRFATRIIAVSQATKSDLVEKVGIEPSKVEVIYEAASLYPGESGIGVNFLKKVGITAQRYFLFVGTIQPRKNLERVIEAYNVKFGKAEDAPRLVLAGSRGWLSEPIYNLVKVHNLCDKVLFVGRVEDKDLPVLYKNALGLVFPSLFEGFGLPILEAFGYGTPVITSNVSSMPEVAGDAAILVNPNSEEEIAEAMKILSDDKKLRQDLIQKGKKQLQKFSWERCAKETLKLLEGVAKK